MAAIKPKGFWPSLTTRNRKFQTQQKKRIHPKQEVTFAEWDCRLKSRDKVNIRSLYCKNLATVKIDFDELEIPTFVADLMPDELHSILLAELFDALQIEELRRCDVLGLPCLSGNQQIVAAMVSKNRSLLIKLPTHRVKYLEAEGWGQLFSTIGRIHPEWIEITHMEPRLWVELIREASRYSDTSNAF